jgi:hypothetical protein
VEEYKSSCQVPLSLNSFINPNIGDETFSPRRRASASLEKCLSHVDSKRL